jgi:drug/metabolite transporter (DMT)-like permease
MVTGIVLLLAGIVLLALGVSLGPNAAGPIALIWIAALLLVVGYLALRRLQEDVVELDEERKAAMVSNLLVVLCSEQATQQVVNTGSLYQ